MRDLLIWLFGFAIAEVQIFTFLYRMERERDSFLRAFEKHLRLYRNIYGKPGRPQINADSRRSFLSEN